MSIGKKKVLKVALDTSGSMSGVKYDNAVLGVQQIWKSDFTEKFFKEISTSARDEFREGIYRIASATGATPLYKSLISILEGLNQEESKNKLAPTVICIFTDGDDTEGYTLGWDRKLLVERINYYTSKNVTFTFICTTNDARNIANIGIPEGNIITHNNTGAGVAQVMDEYVLNLNAYSKEMDLGINDTRRFFKKNLVGGYTPTSPEYFSETSYFKLLGSKGENAVMLNLNTNEEVEISNQYVQASLTSASQFTSTVKVGKEDKYWTQKQIEDQQKKDHTFVAVVGDLKLKGMKTIWDDISSQVFTVTYRKVGKELSAKAYDKLLEDKANEVLALIEEAKNSKKGVAKAASTVIVDLLKNPITRNVEGELRVLTGRKLQFTSQDGFFKVVDFEVTDGQPRSVNINTVEEIIVNGVKYILD